MNIGLYRYISLLLIACLYVLQSQYVMAVACSAIFTNGIQAHAPNGNIKLDYHSTITGGNATLATKTLTDSSAWAACSGSSCAATGTAALTSVPTFVTGTGANGAVNVVYQGTGTITSGNYTTVNVAQEGKLTFSSATGSYKTGATTTNLKSILELQSGDYWINGNLTIGQETLLRRVATAGTTRIFVNGSVSFGYKASTTGFASNQLLIYATGSITANNETTLSAYLYGGGNVSLDYRVIINGAVAGANFIGTGNEVNVNYQGSNLSSADFAPFCTSVAPPPTMNCPSGISSGITGNYFNNRTLTEPSAASRSDAPIDFSWGSATPGISGINADNFSTRWSGYVRATTSGNYRFQTLSDDGVRLYVNGNLVIDRWNDHSAATDTTVDIPLVADGSYSIVLEYYENGGDATIRLRWLLPGASSYVAIPGGPTSTLGAGLYECTPDFILPVSVCPSTSKLVAGITGKYFNNQTLTAPVMASRLDGPINFDWGTGVPGPTGVNPNNFSVSWNGYVYVTQSGVHRFQTNSDDGVRLWVNEVPLIDQWNDHSVTTHTSTAVNLKAGYSYPIKFEFYENAGYAVAQLRWQTPASDSYVAIPIGVNAKPVTSPGLYQCNTVAGYAISHSGTGVTCAGDTITFTALDFDGAAIKPVNGTNIILGTTPTSSQWVNGNTAGFDGTTTSVTKTLRQSVPAIVNIDVRDNNGITELSTKDPSIEFKDAVLKFSDIPTQTAGVEDPNPTLRAIKTDPITGACVQQLNNWGKVRIAFTCINPATCANGQQLTLNNLIAKPNNANTIISYSDDLGLSFSPSGVANIPLRYTDVGNVQLHAQVFLPNTANDPAVTLSGSSNTFVVKPYTLRVTNVAQAVSPSKANPASTTGAGNGFIPAGEKFNVTVQSFNALGNITPNFGNETSASERNKIQLTMGCPEKTSERDKTDTCVASKPDYPVGGAAGILTIDPVATFSAGGVLPVSWNEVGSFRLEPSLSAGYLGTSNALGVIDRITPSGIIGRFYPSYFNLMSSSLSNSCGAFSYMQQPLTLAYSIEAKGVANNKLNNYIPAYGTMPTINYVAENADSGTNLMRFSDGVTKAWASGELKVASTNASFSRKADSGAPDGPFESLQIGLQLADTFDSRSLQNLNMNASATGACSGGSCSAIGLGSALNMRYGRLRLNDAFGPETARLPVNFSTEYWGGTFFRLNTNDTNCTKILRSAITYPAGTILTPANLTVPLNGGTTTGSYSSISATEISFTAGDAKQSFSAPTGKATGNFSVDVDLTSYPWLRFDWNGDGAYDDTALPTARFGFGSYRGHDRVIYWRETF